jgi:hypothetical protein
MMQCREYISEGEYEPSGRSLRQSTSSLLFAAALFIVTACAECRENPDKIPPRKMSAAKSAALEDCGPGGAT